MDYEKRTIEELKKGYHKSSEQNAYMCNHCGKAYEIGQIYPIGDCFYEAESAVSRHIEMEHGGNFQLMLHLESKYNTLTENQKELLALMKSGLPDQQIAKKTGISDSTVRRQRFTFREKAKQAKLYLAVYEQVFAETAESKQDLIPIHEHATYVDDRYLITRAEEEKILANAFSSLEPLRLNNFPPKEKKKVVILRKIAEQFEKGRFYTEKEINEILKEIYVDYGTIRRYLIMNGHLDRKTDGSCYWLKDTPAD